MSGRAFLRETQADCKPLGFRSLLSPLPCAKRKKKKAAFRRSWSGTSRKPKDLQPRRHYKRVIHIQTTQNCVIINTADDFDLRKIFTCGQCFRWNENPDGSFSGVALGKAVTVTKDGNSVIIDGAEDKSVWRDYFDMERDYRKAREDVAIDDFMEQAASSGAGIRILNQDRWETLCSFVISQRNNIPRIKKIVETLSRLYGNPIESGNGIQYTFPDVSTVARLSENDLLPLRSGYRAAYILSAARAVDSGAIDLEKLAMSDYDTAKRELKTIHGVGDKVANCVILFSLHIPTAFPEDVWIKRALREHYPNGLDTSVFGENAGLAQQYMFWYERERGGVVLK